MKIKLTNNKQIGGYNLPADFQCLTLDFLRSIGELSFKERISSLYNFVTGKNLNNSVFDGLYDTEFFANVLSIDEGLALLELIDGKKGNYEDYFFNVEDKELSIVLFALVIVTGYVDLCDGGFIDFGDKINIACDVNDGRLLLALYFAKLLKLPIQTLILSVEKPINATLKDVYFESPTGNELDEITANFFEEYDYVLDPVSAGGLVSYDLFYSDYEDDNVTLLLSLVSPYYYCRRVLKTVAKINEISIDNAIKKLYNFTAQEIPLAFEDKSFVKFFKTADNLSAKDAIDIIKSSNCV